MNYLLFWTNINTNSSLLFALCYIWTKNKTHTRALFSHDKIKLIKKIKTTLKARNSDGPIRKTARSREEWKKYMSKRKKTSSFKLVTSHRPGSRFETTELWEKICHVIICKTIWRTHHMQMVLWTYTRVHTPTITRTHARTHSSDMFNWVLVTSQGVIITEQPHVHEQLGTLIYKYKTYLHLWDLIVLNKAW